MSRRSRTSPVLAASTVAQSITRPTRFRSTAYESAGSGRRLKGWLTSPAGPNSPLVESLEILRTRSRDMIRNSPHAGNAVDEWVSQTIGTGIKPQSQSEDPDIKAMIHLEWNRWVEQSDYDGLLDFYGQQALAFRCVVEAGEVLVRLRVPANRGLRVPFQVEILEPDHLPVLAGMTGGYKGVADGNEVRYGIEFDPDGARVAYHLYKEHPDETYFHLGGGFQTVRIPADQILHVFRPLRPKQMRGTPWLTRMITKLRLIESYTDAELQRKELAACITGFIIGSEVDDSVAPDDGTSTTLGESVGRLEPGTFMELGANEDVKFAETADVSQVYDKFVIMALREAAIGAGLPEYLFTGNLEKVNYSSIRAGLVSFRRKCEQIQYQIFAFQFVRPIVHQWMRLAVLSGALKLPGYGKNHLEYHSFKYITPGWEWVDPKNDVEARLLEIAGGLDSRSSTIAERGEDVEEVDRENAADKLREKSLGLKYSNKFENKPENGKSLPEDGESTANSADSGD